MFDRGVVHIVVAGDIVDHYFLRFDRETVLVNAITSHNNMNHSSVKQKIVMVNIITSHNNMNQSSGSYYCGCLYC
jgi:predicted YcjX-like family ATPase